MKLCWLPVMDVSGRPPLPFFHCFFPCYWLPTEPELLNKSSLSLVLWLFHRLLDDVMVP